MGILNYTTTISADKTAGEVAKLLGRGGASSVSTQYDGGSPVGIGFMLDTPNGQRHFVLPVNVDGVYSALARDRSVPSRYRVRAQAERVAWRIAKDWVEAQLALVQAEMATLAEVMLPYLLTESGQTLYAVYSANEQKALGVGS